VASLVAQRVRAFRLDELEATRWATPALLVALCAISALLRTRIIDAGFWIDEGLSVGIAHHPLTAIPHLLRQDGSPPLYYMLLHVWIGWFGDGEAATHALSLVFSLACIPAAYLVGDAIFGRVTGWVAAGLAALDPYLTSYGQETRMYSLLALLSIVAVLAYVRGVLEARRRWLPLLVATLVLLLYTHTWALFFCAGLLAATLAFARHRLVEAGIAAGATLLLYAPWLPTLAFQVRHTGAPWSNVPSFHDLLLGPGSVLGGDAPLTAFALAAGVGIPAVLRARGVPRDTVLALGVVVVVTTLVAWGVSQLSPAWASRYLAVVFGPVLLVAAAGLARAGRLGAIALVVVLVLWTDNSPKPDKSDVREVAVLTAPYVHRGDLVISTHPEQTSVVRYYLGGSPAYATPLGPDRDPRVMDWRDALDRMRAVSVRRTLEPELAALPPGRRVILVQPIFRDYHAWKAKWTRLVYRRSTQWARALAADPRFRHVAHLEANEIELQRRYFKPVQADVYVKRAPVS
jgi:mannosyltransferase